MRMFYLFESNSEVRIRVEMLRSRPLGPMKGGESWTIGTRLP